MLQATDDTLVAAVTTVPLPKRAFVRNSTVTPLSFAAYLSPSNCMETSLDVLSRLLALDEISAGYKCAFVEGKHSADVAKSTRSAAPAVNQPAKPSPATAVKEVTNPVEDTAPVVVIESKGNGVPDAKKSEGGCTTTMLAALGAGIAVAIAVAALSLS